MVKKENKLYLLKRLILYTITLFVISIGWFTYENVIIRPFPFVIMNYIFSIEDFNLSPDEEGNYLNITLSIPINNTELSNLKNYVKEFKNKAFGVLDDDIKASVLASRTIMHYSKGNKIRNIHEVISINEDYKSICSENAKIFAGLMYSIGYHSRVIWMCGHTVAEIYHPAKGWILIDPYGNVVFKDKHEQYMSLLSIKENYQNAKAENIIEKIYSENPDYIESNYFNNKENVYNSQKCYVIIDGGSLFNFHNKSRDVGCILKSFLFGKATIAKGIQYVSTDSKKFGNFGITFYKRFIK